MSMLEKNVSTGHNVTDITSGLAYASGQNVSWFPSANIVQSSGMSSHVNHVYAIDKNLSQVKWIIDTGATDHITSFFHLLQDVQSCEATLQLPNGATADICYVGNIELNSSLILKNVLCVPSFAYNLLSISKLIHDTSYHVTFLASKCYLPNQNMKETLELGREEHGLYMLTHTKMDQFAVSIKDSPATNVVTTNADSDLFVAQVHCSDVWHARLGHIPANLVHSLPITCAKKALDVCDSCYLGKQSRLPFSHNPHRSENLFDLVYADLWGPYRFRTHGHCNMFLTLFEDKSRTTWVYLLSDKSVVPNLIRDYVALIQTQFKTTVKVFPMDNGSEFVNTSLST